MTTAGFCECDSCDSPHGAVIADLAAECACDRPTCPICRLRMRLEHTEPCECCEARRGECRCHMVEVSGVDPETGGWSDTICTLHDVPPQREDYPGW